MMKICVLFFMTFFFSLTITAQVGVGEKMIGINTSVLLNQSSGKNEDPFATSTSFSISPVFGFGFKNNWVAGAGIGYSYSRSNNFTPGLGEKRQSFLNHFIPFRKKILSVK